VLRGVIRLQPEKICLFVAAVVISMVLKELCNNRGVPMKYAHVLPALFLIAVFQTNVDGKPKGKTLSFDKSDLGKVPAGWTVARTGNGEGSQWKLVEDALAPSGTGLALAQTAAGAKSVFNLCILEGKRLQDVEVSVAFKAIEGKEDQGGGVVWRYQDANNYYVARMNPLEHNFRLYKVVRGKRIQLATREGLKVPAGEWHFIKVKHVGDKIDCYLDGKKQMKASDGAIRKSGRLGVWSKADARTCFDQFRIRELQPKGTKASR
jgi:3-keto-disaccharide hydrolase